MGDNPDVEMAKSLLRLMRNPTAQIAEVQEVCRLDGRDFVRRIDLRVVVPKRARHSQGGPGSLIYLDLVHPKKGALLDIELIDEHAHVRRLSHDEHLLMSAYLIQFRFFTVLDTATAPDDLFDKFYDSMIKSWSRLMRLPAAPPAEAEAILHKVFTNQGLLKAALRIPGCTFDAKKMLALFRLCEQLASRYLVLVEVEAGADEFVHIAYQYRHAVSESPDYVPEHRRHRRRRSPRRFRHLVFGVPPTTFRVHTPWTKRTDHYSVQVGAVEDYFIGKMEILRGSKLGEKAPPVPVGRRVRWAQTMNRGQRAHAFIRRGRKEVRPVYVGLHIVELPGKSTFRALITAYLSLAAFVMLGALEGLGASGSSDLPALTVALISLVGLGAEAAFPSRGLLGSPMMARVTPILFTCLSLGFVGWVISRPLEFIAERGLDNTSPLVQASQLWDSYGWAVFAAAGLWLAWMITRRYRDMVKAHANALASTFDTNMYSPREKRG